MGQTEQTVLETAQAVLVTDNRISSKSRAPTSVPLPIVRDASASAMLAAIKTSRVQVVSARLKMRAIGGGG
jgi:hypothetical protein